MNNKPFVRLTGLCAASAATVFLLLQFIADAYAAVGALAAFALTLFIALAVLHRRYRILAAQHRSANRRLADMRLALEGSPYGILYTEIGSGRSVYANRRFADLVGVPVEDLVHSRPSEHTAAQPALPPEVEEHLRAGHEWSGEIFYGNARPAAHPALTMVHPVADENGNNTHVLTLTEDLDLENPGRQSIFMQANYDELSGLPNRARSLSLLKLVAENARRDNSPFTVVFVDLDRTKLINDSLGHALADTLLAETARRLRDGITAGDHIGHLGGDKFLLILPGKRDADALPVISDLKQRLRDAFRAGGQEVHITASFGLATFPEDHTEPGELIHCAETAMYSAKQRGGDGVARYRSATGNEAASRLAMESHLRGALERDEFRLVYQPIIDLGNNRLAGAEALVRWHNEQLGNPGPDRFIGVAEETGLIAGIGDWVLHRACREAVQWQREGMSNFHISVNISARQLENDHILFSVKDALEQSGLPPQHLMLEMTEQLLVANDEYTLDLLCRLKELGIGLSLDDFGTGYASLSYLKDYPFDMLKIDRSFIHDASRAHDSRELTNAIIAMAHALGMKVVAEGVEQLAQRQVLRERHCDMAQGYLFSPPLPAEEFSAWAEQYQSVHII